MSKLTDLPKRILIGRALRSDKLGETLLPKRLALPVFASDPLSSVAYAPGEVLLVLSIAGASAYHFSPWIAGAVVVLMFTVVASYRQNVHAYPSGGGDYEVATTNLGQRAGLTVASALLVDYVLTVAVSVASGIENLGSAVPFFATHKVLGAVGMIVVLMLMNLRGVRESGTIFAIPTYAFVVGVFAMIAWGVIRIASGHDMRAPTAGLTVHAESSGIGGFALVFLLLRAFSSGCAALTGVEAISNGVPAFKKPKSKNAATTLALMGLLATTMFVGIIALALDTKVRMASNPASDLLRNGVPVGNGFTQDPVIAQVAEAVFGHNSIPFLFLATVTALVLFLAANTAYNGFPVLGSILAQDRYLPRQLHTRGDRLAFSNGIVLLAGFACVLVYIYGADSTRLIQLYIVGVFVSFTLSQTGMVRHWNRHLRTETDPAKRRRMIRSRAINTFGAFLTGLVLVIVLLTKFTHGAWVAVLGMVVFYATMTAIRGHYTRVSEEIAADDDGPGDDYERPSRVHSIVLVSKLHKPTLRALSYAKLMRSDSLEALSINVDPDDTKALQAEWQRHGVDVPLKVLDSPYREITRPIIEYVKGLRRDSPRDVISVYIPEYVVGRWYEHLLHNQSALRLKGRLLFTAGVMVTSVPWQLESSELARARAKKRANWNAPGSIRRGPVGPTPLPRSREHSAPGNGPDKK